MRRFRVGDSVDMWHAGRWTQATVTPSPGLGLYAVRTIDGEELLCESTALATAGSHLHRTGHGLRRESVVDVWWNDQWVRATVRDTKQRRVVVVLRSRTAACKVVTLRYQDVREPGLARLIGTCAPTSALDLTSLMTRLPPALVRGIAAMCRTARSGQRCFVSFDEHRYPGMIVYVQPKRLVVRYCVDPMIEPCYETFPLSSNHVSILPETASERLARNSIRATADMAVRQEQLRSNIPGM